LENNIAFATTKALVTLKKPILGYKS
jgi:hypothetical protein